MKTLKLSNHFLWIHCFIEHNGHKFKMSYINYSKEDILEKDKYKLEIMKDGVWLWVAGISDVEFYPIDRLKDKPDKLEDAIKFFDKLKDHIKILY